MNSRICFGSVRHRRHHGKHHAFKYKLSMVCLNLKELDHVFKPFWLWSSNRFNWATFWNKRYLDKSNECVLKSAKSLVFEQLGLNIENVYLLTGLSYLGYCFNPISVYLCFCEKKLVAIIAEVTNTPWHEKKCYVLQPQEVKKDLYRASFQKELHVSPFLEMDYRYEMNLKLSRDRIIIHINNIQNNAVHFDATLSLRCKPMNHLTMALALLKFPLMSVKVTLAIHWEAFKLWLKGNRIIKKGEDLC